MRYTNTVNLTKEEMAALRTIAQDLGLISKRGARAGEPDGPGLIRLLAAAAMHDLGTTVEVLKPLIHRQLVRNTQEKDID